MSTQHCARACLPVQLVLIKASKRTRHSSTKPSVLLYLRPALDRQHERRLTQLQQFVGVVVHVCTLPVHMRSQPTAQVRLICKSSPRPWGAQHTACIRAIALLTGEHAQRLASSRQAPFQPTGAHPAHEPPHWHGWLPALNFAATGQRCPSKQGTSNCRSRPAKRASKQRPVHRPLQTSGAAGC